MSWHYVIGDETKGPVSDPEFEKLVTEGVINDQTRVWREGMPDWTPYAEARPDGDAPDLASSNVECAECGGSFPVDETVRFGDRQVCARCKPAFVQRLQESGGETAGELAYASIGARFGARIIDGLLTQAIALVVGFLLGAAFSSASDATQAQVQIAGGVIGMALAAAYEAFFVGRFAATPGKMAFKIKIVRPDGERVSYARALGRWAGVSLSGLLLMIGHLMAIFDRREHRALHDRLCDTRVIKAPRPVPPQK